MEKINPKYEAELYYVWYFFFILFFFLMNIKYLDWWILKNKQINKAILNS